MDVTVDGLQARVAELEAAVIEREQAVMDRNRIIGWLRTKRTCDESGFPMPFDLTPEQSEIILQLSVTLRPAEGWNDWRWR